ncbi:MAG TPA: NfeD family protein [Fimbriimonadaceae bacterium]|nr:NfeD family protein [Fimbriimonadaceae bacterium]
MLPIYIVLGVIGGGLMIVSAVTGLFHGGVDLDHSPALEADHQIDFQHDVSTTEVTSHTIEVLHTLDGGVGFHDFWLAFVSMRFVIYFMGVFGVMGMLLTFFTGWVEPAIFIWSAATALFIGYGGSFLYRMLGAEGVTSGVTASDYVGALGSVLVAPRNGALGKVRVTIKGDVLDLLALSEGEKGLEKGDEIVVVSLEGNKVLVAKRTDYLD